MSIPPLTDHGARDRMQIIIDQQRELIDYYQSLEEKEACHRCHIKEVEFPARVDKVRAQVQARVVNDITNLLEELAMMDAVIAIRKHYDTDRWTPAKHGEAVAEVFLEQMRKNNEEG